MKIFTLLLLLLSGGTLFVLSGCASYEEMGLCTTLGACPTTAECEDGGCEEAEPAATPKKTEPHSTGVTHDIGSQ